MTDSRGETPIYKTVCQWLPWTSHFVKQCDRTSWGQATSVYKNEFNFIFSIKTQTLGAALASSAEGPIGLWNRVTEFRLSHFCLSEKESNFILSMNVQTLGAALANSAEGPIGWHFASAVWPKWAVQPKESEAVKKEQVFQVMPAPLWPRPANLAPFIRKSHAFKACILGNTLDQRMIGAYSHWESPCILPKGVCTSCVAKERYHVYS